MALVGLAVLLVSLLPAFVARRRLDASQRRLVEEVRQAQDEASRVARERQAMATDLYVLDRSVRELMAPGHTTATGKAP